MKLFLYIYIRRVIPVNLTTKRETLKCCQFHLKMACVRKQQKTQTIFVEKEVGLGNYTREFQTKKLRY